MSERPVTFGVHVGHIPKAETADIKTVRVEKDWYDKD